MLPLLVLLGTIAGAWYLLIVRPQKDLQTRHGRLVERLQVGDHVLTVGGIYGRVATLEGTSVVLELAPGLTSRIATDGIARIVHAGEAALPTATTDGARMVDAAPTPRQALDTDMHQHPHPDQQQAPQAFAAPNFVAPQQPYAPQQPAAAPAQVAQTIQMPVQPAAPVQYAAAPVQYAPAPMQYAPAPVQLPAPPAPTVTPRAAGSSIPSFEPRPWGDVAPVNAQPLHHAPMPMPAYAQPQAVPVAPQPMPLHQPFAGAPAPQPVAAMQPVAMAAPVVHHVHAQVPQPMHAPQPDAMAMPGTPVPDGQGSERRYSRAPQGMGSSLRLDDPSLRDTMVRARDERAGLAEEYRKLTAPLVATEPPHPHAGHAAHAHDQQPLLIGHDPNGMPLFATPGAPPTHAVAQFPQPAHPQPAHGPAHMMPRPVVSAPHGTDPALTSAAFQRRTPYAPDPALQAAQAPALAPAHAHAPAHA